MDITSFNDAILRRGYFIFPQLFQESVMRQVCEALENVYPWYREVHKKMGYMDESEGGAHHILIHKGCFLDILNDIPIDAIKNFLGGQAIVNSYGAFDNVKGNRLYLKNFHRDVRSFERNPRMLNMLVMLDDFSLENGATYLLEGSHLVDSRPDEETFFSHAERAEGKAGSVLLFDSRLWHAAGNNLTDQHRRALTLTFTRPYFKQQFDYCRALGYEFCETLPDQLRQLVGFNSRVPAGLDEWYQPLEKRFYKSSQD